MNRALQCMHGNAEKAVLLFFIKKGLHSLRRNCASHCIDAAWHCKTLLLIIMDHVDSKPPPTTWKAGEGSS